MDEDDLYGVFYGLGSCHDLADREPSGVRPRLLGLRSVSEAAAWAMHRQPMDRPKSARRIGFAVPKAGPAPRQRRK